MCVCVCGHDLDNIKLKEEILTFIPGLNLYYCREERRPFIKEGNVGWSHSRLSLPPIPQTGKIKKLTGILGVMVG